MNIELNLPKPYMSWSQLRVWLEDKNAYRDRYYRGVQELSSKYLSFGAAVAGELEKGTIKIPNLVVYKVMEEPLEVVVDGVPFHGYADTFDPDNLRFREYKTGIMRPNGKPRWTAADVKNHGQLDVYSLLIQLKYGSVDDKCHLDWLVTKNKKVKTEFDGHILEADSRDLELTGEVVSFERVITQGDRDRVRFLIKSVAKEISHDFTEWLKTNKAPIRNSFPLVR